MQNFFEQKCFGQLFSSKFWLCNFFGQKYLRKRFSLNEDEIATSLNPAYIREFTALHLLTACSE